MNEGSNDNSYTNSPFEESWWLDLVAPGRWNEVVVKEKQGGERIVARLPYVLSNGSISLPVYTQTLGIWMAEEFRKSKRGNDHLKCQKDIIFELINQLPHKVDIDLTLDCVQEYVLPFRWLGFNIEPRFSYRITSLEKMQVVEANFSKNIKRDYNRGEKVLWLDESLDSLKDFITLQNLTYERQRRKNPIENDMTEKIIKKTIESGRGQLMIARDEQGNAHAGSFMLYDDRICYHLMSGQDTAYGNDGAMPFLLYNEILFAKNHSKQFDFEGSMIEGIEQVYRRYGGDLMTIWRVSRKGLLSECMDQMKPRIKRLIGYKI